MHDHEVFGMAFSVVGKSLRRVDGEQKVTGRERFTADMWVRGVLHGRLLLSPYAHAKIRRIPKDAALRAPGVVAVVTVDDLPSGDPAPSSRARFLLARGEVRYEGEPVAVVLADTEAAAEDGLERLSAAVEYEPLPALVDPVAAGAPDAPLVQPDLAGKSSESLLHAAIKVEEEAASGPPSNIASRVRFSRGDVERGFRDAAVVVGRRFRTSVVHQAYLEPHATVADYDPFARRVTIWTATQGLFYARENVAAVLGLPESSVRVVPMAVGGGFGAKVLLLEPLAAAIAVALGRPIRLLLTRADEFRTGTPAPQSILDVKLGARQDGTISALQARLLFDAGAYPGAPVNIAALLLGGTTGRRRWTSPATRCSPTRRRSAPTARPARRRRRSRSSPWSTRSRARSGRIRWSSACATRRRWAIRCRPARRGLASGCGSRWRRSRRIRWCAAAPTTTGSGSRSADGSAGSSRRAPACG